MYGWRRPYCNPGMLDTKYICHDLVGFLFGHVGVKIHNFIGQHWLKHNTTAMQKSSINKVNVFLFVVTRTEPADEIFPVSW